MADINTPGSLLVGEGVFMQGTMRVPGTASIDGRLEGELTADTVIIQHNGAMDGRTTANHVRVAGVLNNTTIANKTLLIETSGRISGSITYEELEIKKGGALQGGIYKVGQQAPAPAMSARFAPAAPAAAPSAPAVAPEAAAPAVVSQAPDSAQPEA